MGLPNIIARRTKKASHVSPFSQRQYQIQTADVHSFQNVRTSQRPEIIDVVHQNENGNHAQQ